jgi:hypothetical protein
MGFGRVAGYLPHGFRAPRPPGENRCNKHNRGRDRRKAPGPFHSPGRRLEIDLKFKIPDSRKEPIAPSPALFEH